jgi:hypothetical protein
MDSGIEGPRQARADGLQATKPDRPPAKEVRADARSRRTVPACSCVSGSLWNLPGSWDA